MAGGIAGGRGSWLAANALLVLAVLPMEAGAQDATFDGKYVAESMRCFPNNGVSSASDLTVRNGAFQATFREDYTTLSCAIRINTDGTFSSARECRLRVSGKIEGRRMTMVYKTDLWECTAVRLRKADGPPGAGGRVP